MEPLDMERLAGADQDRISGAATRVLLALVSLHEATGRATIREVARLAGRNVSTTYSHLTYLRYLGFVDWEPDQAGTLRPLVALADLP